MTSGDKNGQEVIYGSGFGNGEASIRSKHQHRKVVGKSSPTLGLLKTPSVSTYPILIFGVATSTNTFYD